MPLGPQTLSSPPATRQRQDALVETLHGTAVPDPYRWLEAESAEVEAWTRAQAVHTQTVLATYSGQQRLQTRLRSLLSIGTLSAPIVRGQRLFFHRRSGTQEQPVLYVRQGLAGPDTALVDPASLSADGTTALDWSYPSDDGALLAYGISEAGSEQSTLRVLNVDTGRALPDSIPWTRACSLAWQPDGRSFFYTRYPEPGSVPAGQEHYHRHVYRHRLGCDWPTDVLVFGLEREPSDWPNVHLSPDGNFLAVSVACGWTRTDVYLVELGTHPDAPLHFDGIVEEVDSVFEPHWHREHLYLLTDHEAPHYRLVAVDPRDVRRSRWRTVLPEQDRVLERLAFMGDHLVAIHLEEASSRVTLHDLEGRRLRDVPLPGIGTVEEVTGEREGSDAFLTFSSFTTPPQVLRVVLRSGEDVQTPAARASDETFAPGVWEAVTCDVDPSDYRISLVRYPSRDGTSISMFLIRRNDRPEGPGPALLTGYGGFNVSMTPSFQRHRIVFLERGGLVAIPHLRGGAEYGEGWHRAGMREHKQNVFDDFIAAAEHLVAEGLTTPDSLAIAGGSNGGLLVGAVLTQRPELFRAVVCQVPLLDMLRYHHFQIARLWIPEYGNPEEPEAFRWLVAYSPYHRVVNDTAYPAVLLTAGASDSRVDPLHARKMAARLQTASSSGRPVLLRVETRAGHGQGKPLSKMLDEVTDVWTFIFAELGLKA